MSSQEDDDLSLNRLNKIETPFYFINSKKIYNFKYEPFIVENSDKIQISKFPYPDDFDSKDDYLAAVKNWSDSTFAQLTNLGTPTPILPVPTTAFYRRFDLEFAPKDVFQKKKLKLKLGEKKYPLSNNNLLELEDKILNSDHHELSSNSSVIDDTEVFKEKSYQNRPLEYKYHFFQNNFFQLVPPEPLPYLYDDYETYEEAMNNWYQISNQQCPRYKNVKSVEEIGVQLGIQFINPSTKKKFKMRNKIEIKNNSSNLLNNFNFIMKTNLNEDKFENLKQIDFNKLEENLSKIQQSEVNNSTISLSFADQFDFDPNSFSLLNQSDYEDVSNTLLDGINIGFCYSMLYYPIGNNDITSKIRFMNMRNDKSHSVQRRFDSFPSFLLNNENLDEFAYFVNSRNINFCEVIYDAKDFKKFLLLIDHEDKLLSQKATFIIKTLFSSEETYEKYLKALVSFASIDSKHKYDHKFLDDYNLLKKFIRIIERAGELNDKMIPPMMYKINLEKDEEAIFYKSKKQINPDYNNFREFNKKKVLSIYRLCSQSSLLMVFNLLFDYDHWNIRHVHDYVSFKILKPLMFKLAKKVQKNRNEIVSCYITHTVRNLYQTFKKSQKISPGNSTLVADDDILSPKKNAEENDDIDEQEEKLSSLAFQMTTESISKQITSLPKKRSSMLIPTILYQDNQSDESPEFEQENTSNSMLLTPPSLFDADSPHDDINDNLFSPISRDSPLICSNSNKSSMSSDIDVLINSIDSSKNNLSGGKNILSLSPEDDNVDELMNNMKNVYSQFKQLLNDKNGEGHEDKNRKKKKKDGSKSSKHKKKSHRSESSRNKHTKNIAYRIIFMIMNIPYPQLHYALFYPSPINFFNSLSQLQTKNDELDSFLNIASGSCMKTEKLKIMFLTSDAFKSMLQYIINFDISILEMPMVSFTRRVLMWLNLSADKAFSRRQLDILLKSYNPSVPRFNYAICPIIAGIYTNTANYLYKSNNTVSMQHSPSGVTLSDNSEVLSSNDNISSNDDNRRAPSIIEPSSSSSITIIDLNDGPTVKIEETTELEAIPRKNLHINRKKAKSKKSARVTQAAIQQTVKIGSFDSTSAQHFSNDSFEAIKLPTMSSGQFEPGYISLSSSLNDTINTPVPTLMPPSAFTPKDRRKTKNVSVLESFEISEFLDRTHIDNEHRNFCLRPQYAGHELKTDASLLASLLGGLFSIVDASCFPSLLRAVDFLTCSPDVQFPPTFWGKLFGALTVAETTSWIFLRTIFKQGFVKLLPSEFPVFFLLVFKYRLPNEESIPIKSSKKKPNDSDNILNFENLNKKIERQKQLSLKLMLFTAVITAASESSLIYLSKIMVGNKKYFQTLFLKSVNPSVKIEKLQEQILKKNQFKSNKSSSLNLTLFASSYKSSMKSIVTKNLANFKRIVDKLSQYGQKFDSFLSLFPCSP